MRHSWNLQKSDSQNRIESDIKRRYIFAQEKKMRLMEPERAHNLLAGCYSNTGRPAIDPAILLRSFILMLHFGYTSVDR